ncbi:MAG TPA: hypothetical protein VKV15_05050 [Bryobacteraceae bacterium]|nr:hypothetical protein [Bryobacteraceae bacterium]
MASQILKDEQTINEILASGPGSRFVLPGDSVPSFISKSIGVNTDRGRTMIDATHPLSSSVPDRRLVTINSDGTIIADNANLPIGSAQSLFGKMMLGRILANGINRPDQIASTYDPLMPCGDLSVFVISGAADKIQGDSSDPIRLLYSKPKFPLFLAAFSS